MIKISSSGKQSLSTRLSLLQQAQSEKAGPAWEELLVYYRPFIRRMLVRMGIKHSEIDDVCQLALMRLWKDLCNYEHRPRRARFRTWLSHLIHSTVVDWHRQQRQARRMVKADWNESEEPTTSETELAEQIEAEWREHIVNVALDHLRRVFSGNAVEVFVRSVEGQSVEQISQELGLSKESVYVLKYRVKKRLVREVYELRRGLEFPQS